MHLLTVCAGQVVQPKVYQLVLAKPAFALRVTHIIFLV